MHILLFAQLILVVLLGLSLGYHVSRAFREIDTYIGEPAFCNWLKKAVKEATHHYDIGLAGMIGGISIYLESSPFSRLNIAAFIFFIFLAAYWDDRADAPQKELIRFAIKFIKKIVSGEMYYGRSK